jgi:hypothetical protein
MLCNLPGTYIFREPVSGSLVMPACVGACSCVLVLMVCIFITQINDDYMILTAGPFRPLKGKPEPVLV